MKDLKEKSNIEAIDIKKPYIKTGLKSIDEVRKKISDRAYKNEGILDLDKKQSDTLLNTKIINITKKIVGEEIKRFADIAGKEISREFENLENKFLKKIEDDINIYSGNNLNYLEQNLYDHLSIYEENMNRLEISLTEKIESEIKRLYILLEEMETRIKT